MYSNNLCIVYDIFNVIDFLFKKEKKRNPSYNHNPSSYLQSSLCLKRPLSSMSVESFPPLGSPLVPGAYIQQAPHSHRGSQPARVCPVYVTYVHPRPRKGLDLKLTLMTVVVFGCLTLLLIRFLQHKVCNA